MADAQVPRDLVLDFVAEQQQLKATEDELDHRVAELARRRNADQAQLYASLQKAGRLKDLSGKSPRRRCSRTSSSSPP